MIAFKYPNMQIYNYANMQSNNTTFDKNKKSIKKIYKYLSRHIHNVLN